MTLRSFLLKLAIFAATSALALGVLFNTLMPPDDAGYMAAWIDKARLLQQTPSPRVILVGGSSLAFGVDSHRLAQAAGMPVINTGLHAGLGLEVILNSVKPHLRQGDKVILTPEYFFFQDTISHRGDLPTLAAFIDVYPQGIWSFGWQQWQALPEILNALVKLRYDRLQALQKVQFDVQKFEQLYRGPAYHRGSFNTLGDEIGHLTTAPPASPPNDTAYLGFNRGNDITLQLLTRFAEEAALKDARVYLFFPYGRQTNCNLSRAALNKLYPHLVERLPFSIVSTPLDNCIADPLFYDTFYHLNAEGRATRSAQMAFELEQLLTLDESPEWMEHSAYTELALPVEFSEWYRQTAAAAPNTLQDPNQVARRVVSNPANGAQMLFHTGENRVAVVFSQAGAPPRTITRVELVKEGALWRVAWAGTRARLR